MLLDKFMPHCFVAQISCRFFSWISVNTFAVYLLCIIRKDATRTQKLKLMKENIIPMHCYIVACMHVFVCLFVCTLHCLSSQPGARPTRVWKEWARRIFWIMNAHICPNVSQATPTRAAASGTTPHRLITTLPNPTVTQN